MKFKKGNIIHALLNISNLFAILREVAVSPVRGSNSCGNQFDFLPNARLVPFPPPSPHYNGCIASKIFCHLQWLLFWWLVFVLKLIWNETRNQYYKEQANLRIFETEAMERQQARKEEREQGKRWIGKVEEQTYKMSPLIPQLA